MIGQTTLGGTLRWYVGWDPTAETQTDMYEFEMDVQQSLRNDETMLNEYINPLMRYLEGEGEVERAALLKRMLGMTKISFVNNDEEHFVKLVTENELQININAYVQRIRPTGKPFMDALVAEAVIGADELMDAKTELLEASAAEFWAEDSFVLPLNIQRCVELDGAILNNQQSQPWKRFVPRTDIVLWLSDPNELAPGSENVGFCTLSQKEGRDYEALLRPVIEKIFSTPHIAAFLPHTRLRNIVLTEDLRTSDGFESLGITVCPDSPAGLIGRPRWQTIFFDVEACTTGAAYRTLVHETMHTWANTYSDQFWVQWNQLHGGDHLYAGTIEQARKMTMQEDNAAIMGFLDHLGVVSPVGLMSGTEDVPEFLRTLMSESGRELLRRRCGFDAVEYDHLQSPDVVMKAKVIMLVDQIATKVSKELALDILRTVFDKRDLRRIKQGQRIFLVQADASMDSYLSCDKLAAQFLREGATVTHRRVSERRRDTRTR
eukprot:GEMP01014262.1.p1 GENE.GEMP01014262.1~~GEMP01014262.1.p1  ORF type:complete len:490 (+),score=80.19 GEMP01014262.1:490-1959(+)